MVYTRTDEPGPINGLVSSVVWQYGGRACRTGGQMGQCGPGSRWGRGTEQKCANVNFLSFFVWFF